MLKPKNKGWRLLTLPAILLLILLVVAVAACTGDGNGDSTGTEHGTPTQAETSATASGTAGTQSESTAAPATDTSSDSGQSGTSAEPATEPPAPQVGMRLNDGDILKFIKLQNQCTVSMADDPIEGAVLKMETSGKKFTDPHVELSYAQAVRRQLGDAIDLSEYPFLMLKVRCVGCTSATFELFWASGTQSGMSSSKRIQMPFDNADESWQYIVFNMSGNGEWAGKLNALRFDYELQAEGPGETMYISSILFARTADEMLAGIGNPKDPREVVTDPVLESRVDSMLEVSDPAPEPDNTPVRAEAEDSGISLWFNHSYTKTAAEDTKSTGRNTYLMRLAKNEIEDCHLLLSAADGRTGLTVSVSDFTNANGATLRTDLMYAYYFADVDGETIPDPTPWVRDGMTFDLPAGKSRMFIIKVHTTADSAAGLYEATVTVKDASGNEVKRARVSAYVWNFALPENTSCKTQMDLSWYNIYVAHKCFEGDDSLLYKNYYDYLLENRICAYTLPYDTAGYYTDERILQYLNNPRVVAFNPIAWKKDADADRVRAAYKFLSQNPAWMEKSYFYVVDEPTDKASLDRVNAVGEVLKENFPGYKMMAPEHVNYALNKDSTADNFSAVQNCINVWCYKPYFYTTFAEYRYSSYTPGQKLTYWNTPMLERNLGTFADRMKAEKEGGDELWWYVTRNPESPEITLLMETQAVRYRILFWQQKLYGVDGFLYYLVNDWYEISENQGLNSKHEINPDFPYDVYGNGVLLYCGAPFDEYGPVGSLRLECVRDGIEDFEYLTMLADVYGTETVNALICRLTTSISQYSTDEELFTALRIAVGNLLDKAAGAQ